MQADSIHLLLLTAPDMAHVNECAAETASTSAYDWEKLCLMIS